MTGVRPDQFAPLAVIDRNGVDESVHFGALVTIDADGSRGFCVGDPNVTIYPRSSTKPFQALAMLRAGLDIDQEHLALVCASHNGEPIHQRMVLEVLGGAGLDEAALANTHDFPLHLESAHAAIAEGRSRSALQMNCSGKHAGMLATCVANGWSRQDYLAPTHPLQRAITDTIAEVTGEPPVAIGVDGCGAPAHVMELERLARAARALVVGDAGDEGRRIHEAMSHHAHVVGGTGRHVTAIVGQVPGLMAKDGAESVYVAALADGRAVALKLSDGSGRATATVLLAALEDMGVDVAAARGATAELALGHGHEVGRVRAVGFGGRR